MLIKIPPRLQGQKINLQRWMVEAPMNQKGEGKMSEIQPNQEINVTKNRKDDNPIFSAMLRKNENHRCFTPQSTHL